MMVMAAGSGTRRRMRRTTLPNPNFREPANILRHPISIIATVLMAASMMTKVSPASSSSSSRSDGAVISLPPAKRKLFKNHHHQKHKAPIDYTTYSCDALSKLQAKYPEQFNKCKFARTCNEGDGVLFPSLFCGDDDAPWYEQTRRMLLLLLLSLSLLLLFRLLSSTTDEFFSPGLELFSLTLGLPPRFAGVTLLALGNGAPDVAATMNAILEDERQGYEMALGELTGVTMFVTSVILGVIVSLSGTGGKEEYDGGEEDDHKNEESVTTTDETIQPRRRPAASVDAGVPCQGPLLRDIAILMLVCARSMSYLRGGIIDFGFVYTMLGMYGTYVLLVLGADAYHIFYHAPSLLLEAGDETSEKSNIDGDEEMTEQPRSGLTSETGRGAMSPLVNERTPLVSSTLLKTFTRSGSAPQQQQHRPRSGNHHDRHTHHLYLHNSLPTHSHSLGVTVMEAMSNYSCSNEKEHQLDCSTNSGRRRVAGTTASTAANTPPVAARQASSIFGKTNETTTATATPASFGVDGWAPVQDDGTEPLVIFHPHHAVHPHHGPGGLLFLNSKSTLRKDLPCSLGDAVGLGHSDRQNSWSHGEKVKGPPLKHSSSCDGSWTGEPLATPVIQQHQDKATTAIIQIAASFSTNGAIDDGGGDNPPRQSNDHSRPSGWREAWSSNLRELRGHWHDFFMDIYRNDKNSVLDVIFLSVELPFTIARKLTNPVPCDGYYCRPLVAISLALSPFWLWYYFSDQFSINIFSSFAGHILVIAALAVGLAVMRYSPGGEGPMDYWMVVPLTLYGFAIAATWLDSIADKLVQLLELFGILLRIPATVMGLMVLAPGNSLQDLVANISLSKKGLSTMATTACFAGPIFNLCVGLGLGFWALMKSTGKGEIHVKLPSNIATGFYFTIANCVLIVLAGRVVGNGVIGRGYGYGACGLYVVYIMTSLYARS